MSLGSRRFHSLNRHGESEPDWHVNRCYSSRVKPTLSVTCQWAIFPSSR